MRLSFMLLSDKTMNNTEIEKLNEELQADFDEFKPTYAAEQNLYALKKYVDARIALLEKEMGEIESRVLYKVHYPSDDDSGHS